MRGDEASQVSPVKSFGAVARCKQIVVVGDNKQLPPASFLTVGDDDNDEEDDDDVAAAEDMGRISPDLCSKKYAPANVALALS